MTIGTKLLNSETMLKSLFLRQQQRLDAMIQLEDKMKVRFPDGYKKVHTLRAIAAEVRKLEVGEQWMRGKGGNMPFVRQLEDDQPEELDPIAREMMECDAVDRNIIRELCVRYIDMDQSGRDKWNAYIREISAEGERGAAKAADERAIQPPVSEDS